MDESQLAARNYHNLLLDANRRVVHSSLLQYFAKLDTGMKVRAIPAAYSCMPLGICGERSLLQINNEFAVKSKTSRFSMIGIEISGSVVLNFQLSKISI